MIEKYIVEGAVYEVHPSQKEKFLKKYPDAKLQQSEPGKTLDPVNVEADAGSNNMASDSENGLSDLQAIRNIAQLPMPGVSGILPELKANIATVGYAAAKDPKGFFSQLDPGAFTDSLIDVYANIQNVPAFIATEIYDFQNSISGEEKIQVKQAFKKIISEKPSIGAIGGLGYLLPTGLEAEQTLAKRRERLPEYDNTITEEILKGNDADFGQIGARIVNGGIGSLPYTLAAFNPGTLALMGVSSAAGKYEEELEINPDESSMKLIGNAILSGGIEILDGILTKKVLAAAGVIKPKFGAEAVKKMNEGVAKTISKAFFREAATEMGQATLNKLNDAAFFGREISVKDLFEIFDEGIIGGFTGGAITSVSTMGDSKSAKKERAMQLLMHSDDRKKIRENFNTISDLRDQYKTETNKKAQNQIRREIEKLLISNKKINTQSRLAINTLKGDALIQYAKNVDKINSVNNMKSPANIFIQQKEAAAIENKQILENTIKENFSGNIEFAEQAAEQLGLQIVKAKTKKDFQKLVENETGGKFTEKGVEGMFIGKGKIFINEKVALEQGAVSVGSHEILHPILNAMVGSVGAQAQIVNEFKNVISGSQKSLVEQELNRRGIQEKNNPNAYYTEYLNVFSELSDQGQISFEQNIFDKVKDYFTTLFKGKGFKNIDFVSGQGVYNFLKAYNKSIKEGKLSEEVMSALDKKIISEVGTAVGDFQNSKEAESVNNVYAEKGPQGAFEITEIYRGMAGKIASKYRDVPGYTLNKDILIDEILTGPRGVLDLVNSYNPETKVPLAAYINKFLKSRAIEAANRILDTKFKVDVTEAKAVKAAPEISEEAKISKERPSLRKTLGLNDQVIDKVKNAVIKTFGTRLPNVSTPQFVKELQKRYRTELKPTIAKMMGRQESYSDFLNENFRLIYEILPQSIINKRFSAFAEPVLDDTGKQRREKTAQGNAVFRKKKITRKEFVDYFIGEDVKPSTRGTRKTALAEALSEEIAFDATMSVIKTPEVFTKINAINGLIENYASEVAKQIDRSIDFQFSRESALGPEEKQLLMLAGISGNLNNIQNYPELLDIVKKLFKVNGLKIPRGFGGTTFEFYIQELGNSQGFKNLKFDGDGAMGNTGVDLVIKFKNKNGKEITIPTEIKLNAATNFGSVGIKINKEGKISFSKKDGINMDFITPIIESKIPLYKKMHARAEQIQKEKIPFQFPPGTKYKNSTWEILKKEFDSKERNINIDLKDISVISQHYNSKGVYYIYIGGKGLFALGSNPLGLNVPLLQASSSVYISISNSNSSTSEFANLSLRARNNINEKDIPNSIEITSPNFENVFQASMEKGDLNQEFNDMIENKTGIGSEKRYAAAKAAVAGKDKGRFDLLGIPPSAQDFMGLMYKIVGKGKKGDQHLAWFKTNLLDPFAKAMVTISNERVKIGEKFKEIKSIANIAPKDLSKKISGEPFTVEQAIRTYIWTQQGMEIPGLSKADKKELNKYVSEKENLLVFANQLMQLSPANVYPKPDNNWLAGTLTTDLLTSLNTTTRKEALAEWQGNADVIFSEANMNKLEAVFGKGYRSALENMLQRMQTGRNRGFAGDSLTGRFVDWLNGSVGAIMFFNMRSAVLQTISAVNFVNWSDNNPLKAAAAFANQPQYWGDVVYLMNSDYLVERRNGLKINVNEADIAELAAESKNKAKAFVNKLLKLGFLPTQIADSFAIATGGATFYRNRVKSYIKDGMAQKEAEQQAFLDFREISEESQQSSRPDRISQQQAGPLGRLILAFANTPAQYARLIQKASSDLANGRGDAKTNISKIAYYGAIQNVIFNAMQQALFAMMYGDEPEDEKKSEKYGNIVNGMVDSLLRGTGFAGAAVSTVKNTLLKVAEGKPAQDSAIELINISPPISSKIRKVRSAGRTFDWNKKEIKEKGFALDNPAAMAIGQLVSATTNVPLDRGIKKLTNIKDALDSENEEWIRVATALGWSKWELEWKQDKRKKKKKNKSKGSTLGGPTKL